jgi:hypothetical protein
MALDRYRGLRVSVFVGRRGTGRLTSFLRTDADWVGGGPSQWLVQELSEGEREEMPEGSFWVRSEERFKIHSELFPQDESPACDVYLLVVPTEDGKGLDDPDKTWGLEFASRGYFQFSFLSEQSHKVVSIFKHLLR